MVVRWKTLIVAAAIVAALFAIALPLGDSHHGIGAHSPAVADLGNVVWGAFVVGAVILILLTVVALIQYALRSRRPASTSKSHEGSAGLPAQPHKTEQR